MHLRSFRVIWHVRWAVFIGLTDDRILGSCTYYKIKKNHWFKLSLNLINENNKHVMFQYKNINFTFLALSTKKNLHRFDLACSSLQLWHITYQIRVFYKPILLFFLVTLATSRPAVLGTDWEWHNYSYLFMFLWNDWSRHHSRVRRPMRLWPRGFTQAAAARLATGFAPRCRPVASLAAGMWTRTRDLRVVDAPRCRDVVSNSRPNA